MAVTPLDTNAYAPADTYTDVSGLAALKRGAAAKDPKAIRQVAQQFEAMFTSMMLKSMRDTVGKDPIFGSDQEDMFQGMYDQQLSLQLSKGKGLGLANMLIQQLQRMSAISPAAAQAAATSASTAGAGPGAGSAVAASRSGTPTSSGSSGSGASAATRANFVSSILPQAQAAARQLGVDPRNLIAQAALETNWGQNLPAGSNNLFGVKATGNWTGATASATTTEYQAGEPVSTPASFRSYGSNGQSFKDYVALLSSNPRYAAALNTGSDVGAFATALQRGGYATDPDYARKMSAVAQQVSAYVGNTAAGGAARSAAAAGLKEYTAMPTTSTTDTL